MLCETNTLQAGKTPMDQKTLIYSYIDLSRCEPLDAVVVARGSSNTVIVWCRKPEVSNRLQETINIGNF